MHRRFAIVTMLVLLAVSGPALAAGYHSYGPKGKRFSGKTSNHLKMSFRTTKDGRGVYQFFFKGRAKCKGNTTKPNVSDYAMPGVRPISKKGTFRSIPGSVVTVYGRFTSNRTAKGTARFHLKYNMQDCDTGTMRWTATVR